MNYDEARADLDELAQEMTASIHSWSYSQRLEKLRSLGILAKRALKASKGSHSEPERRNSIENVLDQVKSMLGAAIQLEQLQERYKHRMP